MIQKLVVLCGLFFSVNSAIAQFTIQCKMLHYKPGYKITLNAPFIYGYAKENNLPFTSGSNGNLHASLKIREQKFVTLQLGNRSQTLLTTPGKNLVITIDCASDSLVSFGGSAMEENRLLFDVKLDAIPFFGLDGDVNNPYADMSLDELREKLIQPWRIERDKQIAATRRSTITEKDKELIKSEITYNYYNQLSSFARIIMNRSNRNRIDSFITMVFDKVSTKPVVLPAGPQYYFFVESYMHYLETRAFIKKQQQHLKDDMVLDYFNMSLDSAKKIVADKGKRYVYWLMCRQNFEAPVAENYLAQTITNQYMDKDLKQVRALVSAFNESFPHSRYRDDLNKKQSVLENLLAENTGNNEIKIAEGYDNITSIYQVLNKLKGKVVYLDIWGTWCGPCKQELKYNPPLKTYFRGKDVAWLYLDMDEDNADQAWKDFIRVNNITGMHLRKNRKEIEPFWDELYAGMKDKGRYYPSYFIFDKEGKLVVTDAKRPGDTTALYNQLEAVLNK